MAFVNNKYSLAVVNAILDHIITKDGANDRSKSYYHMKPGSVGIGTAKTAVLDAFLLTHFQNCNIRPKIEGFIVKFDKIILVAKFAFDSEASSVLSTPSSTLDCYGVVKDKITQSLETNFSALATCIFGANSLHNSPPLVDDQQWSLAYVAHGVNGKANQTIFKSPSQCSLAEKFYEAGRSLTRRSYDGNVLDMDWNEREDFDRAQLQGDKIAEDRILKGYCNAICEIYFHLFTLNI